MTPPLLFTLLMLLSAQPQSGQPVGCIADPVRPGGPVAQSRFFEASPRRTHDALEDAMQAAGVLLYESSDFRLRGERVVNRTAILGLPKGDEMVVGRLEAASREGKSGTLVHIETMRQGGKSGEPKQSWSTAILDGTSCLLTTLLGGDSVPNQAIAAPSTADADQPREILLPGGTPVALLLRRYVEFGDLRVGKKIAFEAASDVSVGPDVLIRRGAASQGTVTEFVAEKAGFWRTEGPVALIRIDYVATPNGERVSLSGEAGLQLRKFTTMTRDFRGAAWRAGTRFEATVTGDHQVHLRRR